MVKLSGGEALARSLVTEGVEVVFGIPGIQTYGIVAGLRDEPGIRLISTRHEQAATYMADGYARASGKPGVALVVPGVGLYNAARPGHGIRSLLTRARHRRSGAAGRYRQECRRGARGAGPGRHAPGWTDRILSAGNDRNMVAWDCQLLGDANTSAGAWARSRVTVRLHRQHITVRLQKLHVTER